MEILGTVLEKMKYHRDIGNYHYYPRDIILLFWVNYNISLT